MKKGNGANIKHNEEEPPGKGGGNKESFVKGGKPVPLAGKDEPNHKVAVGLLPRGACGLELREKNKKGGKEDRDVSSSQP